MMQKGYIHVYTGDGKGKTTAALGVVLRTAVSGGSALVIHFLKDMPSGEQKLGDYFGRVKVAKFGLPGFVFQPSEGDYAVTAEGLDLFRRAVSGGEYDLVVADELCCVLDLGLLPREDVTAALERRAEGTEVIITGRGAPDWLIDRADLVTEMRKVKHYYDKGVVSRQGVEM